MDSVDYWATVTLFDQTGAGPRLRVDMPISPASSVGSPCSSLGDASSTHTSGSSYNACGLDDPQVGIDFVLS